MFEPRYRITDKMAKDLMEIESIKESVNYLPVNLNLIEGLRKSAKLLSTHLSTMIEGNRLSKEEVEDLLSNSKHCKGRERDEKEVLAYYQALEILEKFAWDKKTTDENLIKNIHLLVMGSGRIKEEKLLGSPYRDGQNIIKDSLSGKIVYLPPEAKDVPLLMKEFSDWINRSSDLPTPLKAGIIHYQFVTIHPYYDGNGRTARLLTNFSLNKDGYGLKGIYSLEEAYVSDITKYYEALGVGPSHNYYEGREEADITGWLEYFVSSMLDSFRAVETRAKTELKMGSSDKAKDLSSLDPKKRRLLSHFRKKAFINSKEVSRIFKLKPRTARSLCTKLCNDAFLEVHEESKKTRNYTLSSLFKDLL